MKLQQVLFNVSVYVNLVITVFFFPFLIARTFFVNASQLILPDKIKAKCMSKAISVVVYGYYIFIFKVVDEDG